MIEPIPLLIFSDAVSASSGLARITRDIASRIHERMSDVFTVATIGYGGASSSRLPWHQYSWTFNEEWIIHDLPDVWYDFAGDRKGIFMSIQDLGRMFWLARPETCSDKAVGRFLARQPFKKWGYFPIDSTGPNDRLSCTLRQCLLGFDRVLAYTKWAEGVLMRTLGMSAAEDLGIWNVPHGIDVSVFFPRGRKWRQTFGRLLQDPVFSKVSIDPDEVLIGIVATNQMRKDFGLAFEVCGALAKKYPKFRVWVHTDLHDRYWSIPYLFRDFDLLQENLISVNPVSDENMAKLYSCCNLTLGIGNGEGFGYPIFESIACGTPCLHGNYGGAPEFMGDELLIRPIASRMEGVYSNVRKVYDPRDWVRAAEAIIERPYETVLKEELIWPNVWPRWESWLRKGVAHVADGSGDRDTSMAGMA